MTGSEAQVWAGAARGSSSSSSGRKQRQWGLREEEDGERAPNSSPSLSPPLGSSSHPTARLPSRGGRFPTLPLQPPSLSSATHVSRPRRRRPSWDTTYERELQAFREYGDTGEIWFGEESVTRLIRWLERRRVPLDASVLDIGTGNGAFLVELAKSGFSNVTGIDYSPAAIQLSRSIIEKEGLANVKLQVEDFLNPTSALPKFGICVDKGTFDAISLNPDNPVEKRKRYVKSLSRVLETGGFFLITSCNWTKDELLREFSEGFEVLEELPTPKFLFGGRSGNSVTALVFRRKGGASPDGLG
uniref:EEF1A lysine methyltransferase 2 n=1 Tax=Ornithorhynchus anatinus TaxID=9258 RepID=A0A6I8P0V4_ORNAN